MYVYIRENYFSNAERFYLLNIKFNLFRNVLAKRMAQNLPELITSLNGAERLR